MLFETLMPIVCVKNNENGIVFNSNFFNCYSKPTLLTIQITEVQLHCSEFTLQL